MQKRKFKILLIFPPVWTPETPYLSTPTLTAWLRKKGWDVSQMDLNIEFWYHFYDEKKIIEMAQKAFTKYRELAKLQTLSLQQRDMMEKIRQFARQVIKGEIDAEIFHYICTQFGGFSYIEGIHKKPAHYPWESPQKYHDRFFEDISYSAYGMASSDIYEMLNNEKLNPYFEFFEKYGIQNILEHTPNLVGISVIALNQVIPAFTLSKVIKKHLPETYVILGGAWCSHLFDVLPHKLELFDVVDSVVVFEGEEALEKLAHAIKSGTEPRDVPNLIYRRRDKIVSTKIEADIDLNTLATPEFDGLPLSKYWNVGVLPLQTSRGCYWAKCSFCSYRILEPKYKLRKLELVIDDIERLRRKYNAEEICFVDACMEPERLKELSKLLLDRKIDIKWMCMGRFDRRLTGDILELMSKAGCWRIVWGLESGSMKILQYLRKGTYLKDIERILRDAANVGINNRVCLMYGYPIETWEDAMATVNFIENNLKHIESITYTYFTPERHTEIVYEREKFKLKLVNDGKDLAIGYRHNTLLKPDELKEIEKRLNLICEKLEKR